MFKFNLAKLHSCIVWVLHHKKCDPQKLTEIIFQAEILHLNLHARPITGVLYHKGNLIYSLDVNQIYGALNPLTKPLPPLNTNNMSISDIKCLNQCLRTTNLSLDSYLNSLNPQEPVDYKKTITDPEVLAYLEEHDSFSIVI